VPDLCGPPLMDSHRQLSGKFVRPLRPFRLFKPLRSFRPPRTLGTRSPAQAIPINQIIHFTPSPMTLRPLGHSDNTLRFSGSIRSFRALRPLMPLRYLGQSRLFRLFRTLRPTYAYSCHSNHSGHSGHPYNSGH
jgi:hypothetical protein